MPVVLDATPGSPTANSLTTLAAADAYWASQLYNDHWFDADDDQQTRALITATRLLCEQLAWLGWPTTTTQALALPRSGLRTRTGAVIPSTMIPVDAADATAELAGQLIKAGQMPDTPLDTAGIKRLKAGPVELEFDGSASSRHIAWLPERVWSLIGFLIETRAGSTSVPLTRA